MCLGILLLDHLQAQAPAPAAGAPRNWTTIEGRQFQATLVKVQDAQVTLRMPTGQMATIAMARLSAADQTFLKSSLAATPTAPPASANPPPVAPPPVSTVAVTGVTPPRVPPEKRTWPAKVEVDTRAIEVTLAKESAADQEYVYRSEAFEFIAQDKLAGSVMKEIARTFEATRALVQALPWGIDPKPPADIGYHRAKFYVNRQQYVADGAPANTGGVYFSKDRIFRVPFESLGLEMRGKTWFKNENFKNDTIIHEITHQMMHDFLPFIPTWVAEGTAEYTELLPYNAGRFLAGSHERGIKEYLKDAQAAGIKPPDIGPVITHLSMTNEDWHSRANNGPREQRRLYFASCLLVYYFSHLDGDGKGTRFLKYLDKMAEARDAWGEFFKNPKVQVNADGSFRYRSDVSLPAQKRNGEYGIEQLSILLDGRDAAQLQKDLADGFKKIGVRW